MVENRVNSKGHFAVQREGCRPAVTQALQSQGGKATGRGWFLVLLWVARAVSWDVVTAHYTDSWQPGRVMVVVSAAVSAHGKNAGASNDGLYPSA